MPGREQLAPVAVLCGAAPLVRQLLPRSAASVGSVRLLVEDVLAASGISDRSLLDTTVLLASELATDGVRHGTGEELLVEVALGADRVQLTITVDEPRRPGQSSAPVADHSQQVLDIMAAAWEVRTGAGTRTGWCRIDRISTVEPAPAPDDDEPAADHAVRRSSGARPPRGGQRPVLRRVK